MPVASRLIQAPGMKQRLSVLSFQSRPLSTSAVLRARGPGAAAAAAARPARYSREDLEFPQARSTGPLDSDKSQFPSHSQCHSGSHSSSNSAAQTQRTVPQVGTFDPRRGFSTTSTESGPATENGAGDTFGMNFWGSESNTSESAASDSKCDKEKPTKPHPPQVNPDALKSQQRIAVVGHLFEILQVLPTLWAHGHCVVPVDTSFSWSGEEAIHRIALSQCHLVLGSTELAEEKAQRMGCPYEPLSDYYFVPNPADAVGSQADAATSFSESLRQAIKSYSEGFPMLHIYGRGCTKPCVLTRTQLNSRLDNAQKLWHFDPSDIVQCFETEVLIDGGIAPVLAGAKLALPTDKAALATAVFTSDLLKLPLEAKRTGGYADNYRFIAWNMLEKMDSGGLNKDDLEDNRLRYENKMIRTYRDYRVAEKECREHMKEVLKQWYYTPETGSLSVGKLEDAQRLMRTRFNWRDKEAKLSGPAVTPCYHGFPHATNLAPSAKFATWTDFSMPLQEDLKYCFGETHQVKLSPKITGRIRKLRSRIMGAKESGSAEDVEKFKHQLKRMEQLCSARKQRRLKGKKAMNRHDQPDWGITKVPMVIWPRKKAAKGGYTYITKKHTNMKRLCYRSKYIR